MWFVLFVHVLVKAVISNSLNNDINTGLAIYNKCCPKHLELTEVSNNNSVQYDCVNHELSNVTYNITNSTLVANDIAAILPTIIEECDKLHDIDYRNETVVGRNNTLNPESFGSIRKSAIHCYDTLLKQINYTKTGNLSESLLLTCVQTKARNILEPILKINHIKKCCPKGHEYDINNHICKENITADREEWLTKLLNTSGDYSHYYIYEIGELHCEWNDYILDLSEDSFLLKVENSVLDVTDKHWKQNNRVSQGQWCVDRQYGNLNMVARICTKECGIYNAFCFQKCCPFGQYYDLDKNTCRQFDGDIISFNISYYVDNFKMHGNFTDVLGIKASNEYCIQSNGRREIVPLYKNITDDIHGLKWEDLSKTNSNRTNMYCLETIPQNQNKAIVTHFKCDDSPKDKNFRLAFVLNSISSIFLALTLSVYCALPELRNLHGWTLICHVSMMLLAYSSLARVQYGVVEDYNVCVFLGYAIYFGYMSAFLWLSVMCFDIWQKLGTVREIKDARSKKKEEKRKLSLYSLYAWSIVIVFTVVMSVLDKYPVSKYLDAEIGEGRCFFSSILTAETNWPEYIYFRIPMALLTGADIVLWLLTARHCIRVMSEMRRMQSKNSSNISGDKTTFRSDKARYILTAKLGLLMGATWVFEVLSTLTTEPTWLWAITDCCNELQGLFIFIILVCNSKIYNILKVKIGIKKVVTGSKSVNSVNTTTTSTDGIEQHELQVPNNSSSNPN